MSQTLQFCTFYLDKVLFGVELRGVPGDCQAHCLGGYGSAAGFDAGHTGAGVFDVSGVRRASSADSQGARWPGNLTRKRDGHARGAFPVASPAR